MFVFERAETLTARKWQFSFLSPAALILPQSLNFSFLINYFPATLHDRQQPLFQKAWCAGGFLTAIPLLPHKILSCACLQNTHAIVSEEMAWKIISYWNLGSEMLSSGCKQVGWGGSILSHLWSPRNRGCPISVGDHSSGHLPGACCCGLGAGHSLFSFTQKEKKLREQGALSQPSSEGSIPAVSKPLADQAPLRKGAGGPFRVVQPGLVPRGSHGWSV